MSSDTVVALVIGVLTAVNLGPSITKLVRNKSDAVADESTAVGTLKEVIAEIRIEDAKKDTLIQVISQRVEKLEARERNNLKRISVYEGWISSAYPTLLKFIPDYPPPAGVPSLKQIDEEVDDGPSNSRSPQEAL